MILNPLDDVLTGKEQIVFRRLARGDRINAIAKDMKCSPSTISTHRQHVLDKLKANTNADLVRIAMRLEAGGPVFNPPA